MSVHERDEATATSQEDEFHGILSKADIEMDKTLLKLIQVRKFQPLNSRRICIGTKIRIT
jgi:hypothetical protein